ncbi:hypothetical protein [Hydrogenimonas sp.]
MLFTGFGSVASTVANAATVAAETGTSVLASVVSKMFDVAKDYVVKTLSYNSTSSVTEVMLKVTNQLNSLFNMYVKYVSLYQTPVHHRNLWNHWVHILSNWFREILNPTAFWI